MILIYNILMTMYGISLFRKSPILLLPKAQCVKFVAVMGRHHWFQFWFHILLTAWFDSLEDC